MNTSSKSELIRQNKVSEILIRLVSYNAKNLDDFLHLFLDDIVKQTGSSKGFIFTLSEKIQSFELTEMIAQSESKRFVNDPVRVYELSKAGPWIQAFEQKKLFFLNNESKLFPLAENKRSYEVAGRFCSFPVLTDNRLKTLLVITDKETDYDTDDIEFLELLIGPVSNMAENFRRLEDLTKLKENAERNEQRKISYLENISHEIRTPVNAIAGFSQLLKEDNQSPENRKKFLDVILESSNDLVGLINNVAEISNIESGLTKIAEEEVNLSDIFDELTEQFKDEAFRKNLEFQHEIGLSGNDIKILADRTRLLQMLSALLSNSFKFTFTGKIVFGCNLRNGFLEFFVSDSGIGIPKEDMDKVFDHFFQTGDSILKSFKGAGLGLTISKALAEKMGGKIWCDSIEGRGSVFHISIPHKQVTSPSVFVLPSVHESSMHMRRKKTILVAEDDNVNFMLIQNFLSKLDIMLLRAVNGKEAVEICLSNNIDLVLMDIKMPVMDGYTAIRIIRESNPDQIIIAQTAYTNDRETALDKGCNDFIAKPFGKTQFINLVNSYLI
jgi:signal transduction histidine kinase